MLQYRYREAAPSTRPASMSCDQPWSAFSNIQQRPRFELPDQARVALWVCPNLLHYEWMPPEDRWIDAWARCPAPDVMMFGRQDFAGRVGFWRMLEILDRYALRCSAVVNSQALREDANIRAAVKEREWSFLGHGICNTRFVFEMDPEQEMRYYTQMRDEVETLTGVRMRGTGGPGPQAATPHTLDVLGVCGFDYHADWFHDDQPWPLQLRSGQPFVSLPYAMESNDAPFLGIGTEARDFADLLIRQFDQIYREGSTQAKVMCISLHPALFGQAQRAHQLDRVFSHILSHSGVWQCTGDEIVSHFMQTQYDGCVQWIQQQECSQ